MQKKPKPKRHHYVPQMVLRRFANPQGMLYFFDKRLPEKRVLTATPQNIFLEGHLYTVHDKQGTKDVALECYLAELDGKADRIIEKIVTAARSGRTSNLSEAEKATWDLFFYYQWKRVPDSFVFFGDFQPYLQEAVAEFENSYRLLTPEERRELQDPDVLRRIEQNAKVQAIANPGQDVQHALSKKGLGVAVITKRNKSFVVGSFPIVKLTLPGRTHLADPAVEIWFPIAPDVAVTPALPPRTERLVQVSDDRYIRAINEAIFKQSTLVAGRSRKLIASLTGLR